MSEMTARSVHWSFWLIGTVMLVWNVMGCINIFVQMNPGLLTAYRVSERAIVESRPTWATGSFAIAVFGGALGCLLLLLRKSSAYYLFIASLLGVIVTMTHTISVGIEFSLGEMPGTILMPLAVAAFLILYSKLAESKG